MEWLAEYGYIGLFFGSFVGATVIPLSSDLLLIGLLVAGGEPIPLVIAASLGNWLGGVTSYGIGWLGKWEWIEKWFKVTPAKLEKQRERIQRHGSLLALFVWVPIFGDLIAIGLGFYRIDFKKTAIFMLIGKSAKFILWAVLFHYYGPYFMEMVK